MKTTKEYFIEGELIPKGTEIKVLDESKESIKEENKTSLKEARHGHEEMHEAIWFVANGFNEYESLLRQAQEASVSYEIFEEIGKKIDRGEDIFISDLSNDNKLDIIRGAYAIKVLNQMVKSLL